MRPRTSTSDETKKSDLEAEVLNLRNWLKEKSQQQIGLEVEIVRLAGEMTRLNETHQQRNRELMNQVDHLSFNLKEREQELKELHQKEEKAERKVCLCVGLYVLGVSVTFLA